MRRLAVLAVLPLLLVACGDDDDDGGGVAGDGDGGAFCDRATVVDQQFQELESSFEGSEMPNEDVFDQAADALDDLADGAPDDIAEDLQTIADGAREIGEVFADIDLSDTEGLAELAPRMEEIGEEVEAASGRVEAYLEEECGISIDDGAGDDEGGGTETDSTE